MRIHNTDTKRCHFVLVLGTVPIHSIRGEELTASCLEARDLWAGEYDRLAQVLQHEGEGGGGVGQGVRTVQHHKPGYQPVLRIRIRIQIH